jgi:hypothetical protein
VLLSDQAIALYLKLWAEHSDDADVIASIASVLSPNLGDEKFHKRLLALDVHKTALQSLKNVDGAEEQLLCLLSHLVSGETKTASNYKRGLLLFYC